jgi:hypothetical protein
VNLTVRGTSYFPTISCVVVGTDKVIDGTKPVVRVSIQGKYLDVERVDVVLSK